MDVTLYGRWKVVVDNFSDTFEIHPSGHDLRTDQYPAFTFAHTTDSILSLFFRQTGM